ncbi:GNAT family N-acetyltransferase [Aquimarina rhabdastrellae]
MKNEITITPYISLYQDDFRILNETWIKRYFKMEDSDYKSLLNPQEYIIDNDGHILVALYNTKVVGVCALIKMDHPLFDYELAKMAVDSSIQGKGIGFLLGQAIIDKAKSLNAKNLYLESNTILEPAINLYYKLGFKKIEGIKSPYERCNIQMELTL